MYGCRPPTNVRVASLLDDGESKLDKGATVRAVPVFIIRARLLLVLALTAALVAAAAVPGLAGHDFDDVDDDHPFHDEISWLVDEGIATGYADDTFRPTVAVSRQAKAAFLFRYAGEPEGDWESDFDDVPETHPFYEEISWAAEQGVASGFGDGTFRPTVAVSRQASVAFVFRFAGEPEGDWESDFDDVPETHPFYEEISWAAELGVTEGFGDDTYRPTRAVSRQAVAAFLFRTDGQLGSVAGEVREPGFLILDGDPIEGAWVWIDETDHEAVTGADGAYSLAHVPPGEYTLNASAEGYEPDSQTVTVEAGDDLTGVDFELEPHEEAEPAVEITDPTSEQPAAAPVGSDLDVTFEVTRSGEYALTLRETGEEGDWLAFDGAGATGIVSAGEHTVTVTVPDEAEDDEVYDLRATFDVPEEDRVEDVQDHALVTADAFVHNVDQDRVHFTLADADHEADAGDTLVVSGTLTEPHNDLAASQGTPLRTDGLTVDGGDDGVLDLGEANTPVFLDGDDQTVTGLRFEDFDVALGSDDHLTAGDSPTITDNTFADGGTGLVLDGPNAATVTDNTFVGTEVGVTTADDDADIVDNVFSGNALGVLLEAEDLETTVADNVFDVDNDLYLCDATASHDLSSDGDLAVDNDYGSAPPIAFDDCLRPELDEPYVHNVDSFLAHRNLGDAVDAAGSDETLEAFGAFAGQVDLDVSGMTLRGGHASLANDGASGSEAILTISAGDVTVEGLTVTDDEAVASGQQPPVAVQVDTDGATLTGLALSRDVAGSADQPLLRVEADEVVVEDSELTGGQLALHGEDGDGVFDATLVGNSVSHTAGAGIHVEVGSDPLGGVPLIGDGASLTLEGNTVTEAGLDDAQAEALVLTLVPGELNGEDPDGDEREVATILFRDNPGIATVAVAEESYQRDR